MINFPVQPSSNSGASGTSEICGVTDPIVQRKNTINISRDKVYFWIFDGNHMNAAQWLAPERCCQAAQHITNKHVIRLVYWYGV